MGETNVKPLTCEDHDDHTEDPIRDTRCPLARRRGLGSRLSFLASTLVGFVILSACTPKVIIQTPNEPIVINLNIKIEHEVKIKIDKELDSLIDDDDDLF